MADWIQCRERSAEATYCVLPDGHLMPHEDKWGCQWDRSDDEPDSDH